MIWLLAYLGIGLVFAVMAAVGNSLSESRLVRACVYVGLVWLWPLTLAVEIVDAIQQKRWERKQRQRMDEPNAR